MEKVLITLSANPQLIHFISSAIERRELPECIDLTQPIGQVLRNILFELLQTSVDVNKAKIKKIYESKIMSIILDRECTYTLVDLYAMGHLVRAQTRNLER